MGAVSEHDDPRSDEALVAAANGGDAAAFEALYRRHRDWAMALAYRVSRDPDLAADVVQETFLDWLRRFPGFELRAQVRTFLHPIVRHTAIRLAQRRRRDGGGRAPEELPADPSRATGADANVVAALAELTEGQREVMILRFADGLSLAEIATALGVPLGTVKSRLHHALAALRGDPRTRDLLDE